MTISIAPRQQDQHRVIAFCSSPILGKLCSEHGELVADSVHYLENNAVRDDGRQAKRRLAVVRLIVEMASWLNACRAVGSGHRAALAAYAHDVIGQTPEDADQALCALEARANNLGERIARIDTGLRSAHRPDQLCCDIFSQLAVLRHAAGSRCFRA